MGIERVKEEAFETDGAARWSALSLNSYCDREGLAITACARSTMAYRALHEIVAMLMRNQRETAEKQVIGNLSGTGLLPVISSLTASQRFVFSLLPVPPI